MPSEFQTGDLIRLNPEMLDSWGFDNLTFREMPKRFPYEPKYHKFPVETVFLVVDIRRTLDVSETSERARSYIILNGSNLVAIDFVWASLYMRRV
jgi:hypothetical protein